MRFKFLLIPLFLVFTTFILAQESGYNLPPGYSLMPDQTVFNLSKKLDDSLAKDIPVERLKVLKDITESQLKETSVEYQEYVKKGQLYIDSLSKKVRNLFNDTELWYIYAFDQDLKEKLLNIN